MQTQILIQERVHSKEELRAILLELQNEIKSVPRDDIIAVSQVAEKAWVAFVTYVKVASGKQIGTHAGILEHTKQLIRKDKKLQIIHWNADALHRFHYAPFVEDVRGGLQTVLDTMQFVLFSLKARMKRLPN